MDVDMLGDVYLRLRDHLTYIMNSRTGLWKIEYLFASTKLGPNDAERRPPTFDEFLQYSGYYPI